MPAVLGLKAHVKRITGSEPETCPWRVFYDPLVGDIVRVATLAEKNLGAAALGDDPYAIHVDALATFLAAKNATIAHDMTEERKRREALRPKPKR